MGLLNQKTTIKKTTLNHPESIPPHPPGDHQTSSTWSNLQDNHFQRARATLRELITRYTNFSNQHNTLNSKLPAALQTELDVLASNLAKLDHGVVRIAAFGLVSRGKSAVLNALIGQKILQTGPLNGVTQWPIAVRWTPNHEGKIQIELIDTPGLDEIEGQARAEMSREVARQADLILFVVAGDITRTEYEALCELRTAQKPMLLVFNKIDLYPEQDRQAIYQQLQNLGGGSKVGGRLEKLLSADEIVMVAAAPVPREIRVEWPNGEVTAEWESPPPMMDELKQKILNLLNQEGRSLLAVNALIQAKDAQIKIANKTLEIRHRAAADLIWEFAKYKSLAVAVNPIFLLDLIGGTVADLALIRALAKLYNLPMTGYEASKLLKKIMISAGGLLLSELSSSFLFGLGKTATAIATPGIPAYLGAAIAQASLAGYGTYVVGQAAQIYLELGCTWGPDGPDTMIHEILNQVESHTILYRLRKELKIANR